MCTAGGVIEGKYEVLGKIREGGMGAIYMVRHRLLNEIRVIKVMRPEVAESADQRKRFLREAQMATRLKHNAIVSFYDFFLDEEGTAYMVMEYIDGISLRDMLRARGALPVTLGLDLARQCLWALDYLHRKGIVHRDIAPDNIMLTREEDGTLEAKLIDLGIAKLQREEDQEQLTAADEFIGKLRYSSPEQLTRKASSDAIDGRSDIFSFGVVLYEALTGVCPYRGGSLQDILAARLHDPPMPFEQTDPRGRLGADLRTLIARALRTKPEDRFQTASDFARAIEALPPEQRSPESPSEVQHYVQEAIAAAREAFAAANPSVSGVQKTLQSKFRVSEVSIRPLEGSDVHLEKTIARLGSDAAPAAATAEHEGPRGPEKTVLDPAARGAFRRARGGAPSGLKIAIGIVAAAVLLLAGVLISNVLSRRNHEEAVRPTPEAIASSSSSSSQTSVSPLPAVVLQQPTALAAQTPTPTAAPSREPVSGSAVSGGPEPGIKAHPKSGRVEPAPVAVARRAPAAAGSSSNRPKMRLCSDLSRTAYIQGVPKEVPPGFRDVAALPAREDAGRIKIAISVLPESPLEGEEFVVVATFVNGGDGGFRLSRIEESVPSARGGFAPMTDVATPTTVDEGGKLEIYRSRRVLGAGETYRKAFRVVEQRRNDVWEASITVKPCVEQ